jgi:endonuclease/exonuclease/phosphatase family metal-dependent hydrolase
MMAAFIVLPQLAMAQKVDEGSEGLKVMSYNIRLGSANDGTNSWHLRYQATDQMLKDQRPDVFGVQEALEYQVRYIKEMCGYESVGVGREDGKKEGEFMSIFWNKKKVSMVKWGTFWLSETPKKPSKGWDAACFRTATWALMKDKKTGNKFYFVNTHLDHKGKEATIALLEDVKPDVFGVQEALPHQVADVTEQAPNYKKVGVGRDDGVAKGEFMSIFWNVETMEMLEWGTYWLSETPDVPSYGWDAACRRTATWALMKDKRNGKKFYFVNTHLDHRGVLARKNGLQLVVDNIAAMNPEGYPMVLTGDFNVLPDDECLVDLDKQMQSARKIAKVTDNLSTFNGWGNKKPEDEYVIDYIYVSGFKSVPEYRTNMQQYAEKPYISDHYPIVSVLEY